MDQSLCDQIKEKIAPVFEGVEADLIELNINQRQKEIIIEVLTDKPEGGISLDECTSLHRKIQQLLEEDELVRDNYTLQVSSPGLDRLLKTKQDFMRISGREVEVTLLEPVNKKTAYRGVIKEVGGDHLILKKNSDEVCIPIANINEGKQII